jgi:hypothetical protein
MKKWSCILILLMSGCASNLHNQLKFTLKGHDFTVPNFKSDSVATFNNGFVKDSVISSIKRSKYDVEIRMIYSGSFGSYPGEGVCISIRGDKDTLYAVENFVTMSGKDYVHPGGKILQKYNNHDIRLAAYQINLKPDMIPKIIESLIDNHLMDRLDNKSNIKKLTLANVKLKHFDGMDCCSTLVYEIKIGNHYRNTTTNYYYQAYNSDIKVIKEEADIDAAFRLLAPNMYNPFNN